MLRAAGLPLPHVASEGDLVRHFGVVDTNFRMSVVDLIYELAPGSLVNLLFALRRVIRLGAHCSTKPVI